MNVLESKIQKDIIKSLEVAGWLVIKLIQTNRNGIPDLVCHKDGRTVYIEVKRPGKQPTKLQLYRLNQLWNAGIEAFVMSDVEDTINLR